MQQPARSGGAKNLPKYTGTLQTNSSNPKMRKRLGRITFWENASDNPRAPVLYGQIATNYGKSVVALWRFVPKERADG
jgi:hypothetical protein